MRLEDVLPAYREGKAIRREAWGEGTGYAKGERGRLIGLTREDIDASDWLVIDNPITITREQFERAYMRVQGIDKSHLSGWHVKFWEELQK